MGVEAIVSSIMSGITLAGNTIGSVLDYKAKQDATDASVKEAQKNREFEADMLSQQQAFQHQESDYQFQRQAEYDSPSAKMARYEEAGLNPSVAMMDGNGLNSAFSTPSVSAPNSGVTGYMPNIIPKTFDFAFTQQFSDIAQGLKHLADAKKTGADVAEAQKTFESRLSALTSDAKFKELQADLLQLFGKRSQNAEIQKAISQAALYDAEAFEALSKNDVNLAEKQHKLALAQLTNKQSALADKDLQMYDERFEFEKAKALSESNKNNAQAEEARYNKDYVMPEHVNYLAAQAKKDNSLADVYAINLVSEWEEYQNMSLTSEQRNLMKEKVSNELRRAIHDNSSTWWNPVQAVAWLISPLARTIGIALGGNVSSNIVKKPVK